MPALPATRAGALPPFSSRAAVRRVTVTSTVPDALNTNWPIRTYLADGFREAVGEAQVAEAPFELATEAIARGKPDLVVAVGGVAIDGTDLRPLRRAADRADARLAFWLHDDPYEFDYAFRAEALADVIFSNDAWAVPHYRAQEVHHLPMAGCPKRHFREILPPSERAIGLFFCGVGYPNRIALLRRARQALERQVTVVRGDNWPDDLPFARNQRLSPDEAADCARHAMLTLNIGRDLNLANRRYGLPPSTPGPRTFEVALAGCAQLYFVTGLEIADYFEPGREIVLCDSAAELADILLRAAEEPEYFVEIAAAAQRRALQEHCYRHRAERILATLFG
jgi:spore maturation protein CgeB